MKEVTMYQLFCKLRGETSLEPLGSTYSDEHKLNAQCETQELASCLIFDITNVAQTQGSLYSIQKARKEAIKWLKATISYMNGVIEESEEV